MALEPVSNAFLTPTIEKMVEDALRGLQYGITPTATLDGTGGSYFMWDALKQRKIAIFKPTDEEPYAVNNPRGYSASLDFESLRKGHRAGEGAHKEVGAFLLDHHTRESRSEEGFSGVPPTVMVNCHYSGFTHPKQGSLQRFVDNIGSCHDFGSGIFPVKEVHKISVLDIRLANTDRHSGNILCAKDGDGRVTLTPIDHGYCLPTSFEECTFEWLYWPQAKKPYDSQTKDYIEALDAEKDIELLKLHGCDLSHACIRTLRISTTLLKKGAARELTPLQIGRIMTRNMMNNKSEIEEIMEKASDSLPPGTSEAKLLETTYALLDQHLDHICASFSEELICK